MRLLALLSLAVLTALAWATAIDTASARERAVCDAQAGRTVAVNRWHHAYTRRIGTSSVGETTQKLYVCARGSRGRRLIGWYGASPDTGEAGSIEHVRRAGHPSPTGTSSAATGTPVRASARSSCSI